MKRATFITTIFLLTTAAITFAAARFTDNGNGTIMDIDTGLIWQKCSNGQSGTDCSTGTAITLTWVKAISYCEGLSLGGRTNWRLPKINDLSSIVDAGVKNPAINTIFFPGTQSSYYWSSSTNVANTSYVWDVSFTNGSVHDLDKTNSYFTRCVSGP